MAVVTWDAGRTKTLTIAQSGTQSDVLDLGVPRRDGYDGVWLPSAVGIAAPALLTGLVGVYGCHTSDGTFVQTTDAGADVAALVNKATSIQHFGFRYLKLVSNSAEAAARSFVISATYGGQAIRNGPLA